MHTINELKDRLLSDLKEIAENLNVGNFKRLSKQDLIYKILDQQAVTPGSAAPAAPVPSPAAVVVAPAPVVVAAAPAAATRNPVKNAGRRPAPSTAEQPFSDVAPPAVKAPAQRPPREPRREVALAVASPAPSVEILDSIEGLALVPAGEATGAALANEPAAEVPSPEFTPAADQADNAGRPERRERRERVDRAGRPITEQRAAEMAAEKVAAEVAAAEAAAAAPAENGADNRDSNPDNRRREPGGNAFGDRRENRADRFERDNREGRDARDQQRPARQDQGRDKRDNREPRNDQPRNGQDQQPRNGSPQTVGGTQTHIFLPCCPA